MTDFFFFYALHMHALYERERTGPFFSIPRVMSLMKVNAAFVAIPIAGSSAATVHKIKEYQLPSRAVRHQPPATQANMRGYS
jgi:hypothetical protein